MLEHAHSPSSSLTLIECGPDSALKGSVQQIMGASQAIDPAKTPYLGLMTRKEDAVTTALAAVGTLWQRDSVAAFGTGPRWYATYLRSSSAAVYRLPGGYVL